MTVVVGVAVLEQVGNYVMTKMDEMKKKLKDESSALHGNFDAEKKTFACALLDNASLQ